MKYLKIINKNEIDQQAFSLIGASTKRGDDTKIGYFGSGNKYAIAYLLRNNIPFRVFSGLKELVFEVKNESFRQQSFGVISINGECTSLTTQMGVDWQLWFVIRELYCNALDEGSCIIEESDIVAPVAGVTSVYIEVNAGIQQVLDDWNLYFSNERTDIFYHDNELNALYSGGRETILYRKGIRCFYAKYPAIFHYDLQDFKINESRTVISEWDTRIMIKNYLQQIKEEKVIVQLYTMLHKNNERYEFDFYWNTSIQLYSETWLSAIKERYLIPYENAGSFVEEMQLHPNLVLPLTMVDGLKERFGDRVKIMGEVNGKNLGLKIRDKCSAKEDFLLKKVADFFNETGYEVKYPIKVCTFFESSKLGLAKDETIYLSDKLFDMGQRKLAEVIIEENEHLLTGFFDETRAFQTHFIQKFISEKEERFAIFL